MNKEPTHPAEMLAEEFLAPMQITQRQLADAIHVPYQRINELVNHKRGITPSTRALCLGRFFGVSAEFRENIQLRWALQQAEGEEEHKLKRIRQYDQGTETALSSGPAGLLRPAHRRPIQNSPAF